VTNTDNLPTWDEIFASIEAEVARYDANILRLSALANEISKLND